MFHPSFRPSLASSRAALTRWLSPRRRRFALARLRSACAVQASLLVASCGAGDVHFDIVVPTDIGGSAYVGNTSALQKEWDDTEATLKSGEAASAALEDALTPVPDLTGAPLVFSAHASLLVRLDGAGGFEVRDVVSGELQSSATIPSLLDVLAVSRDGALVAALAGEGLGTLQVVTVDDGSARDTGVSGSGASQVQFVGDALFWVDANLTLQRFDADDNGPAVVQTPGPLVSTIVAAPDSDRLFGFGRPETNLADDALFVLEAGEDEARALELPAANPRLLSVGRNGCLGFLSGKSLWLSGEDGADFSTDEATFLDDRMTSLAVGPSCRSAAFTVVEDSLVAWIAQGGASVALKAPFVPLVVRTRG